MKEENEIISLYFDNFCNIKWEIMKLKQNKFLYKLNVQHNIFILKNFNFLLILIPQFFFFLLKI